jgi:hypothetical protein
LTDSHTPEKMPPKTADPTSTCLACSKKFNKSEYSLQCTVCGLWVHKTCSGISDDGYKFVSEQLQLTGIGYWACRACAAYAVNMNRRLKQMEDKIEQCSKAADSNTEAIKVMDKKMESIGEELKKKEEKTAKLVKQGELNVFEELRERETRRLNVVFFGIPELSERNADGKAKLDWDRKSCCNVFAALDLDLGEASIKFCRRVGERGDDSRPLIVGFWTEAERASLLKKAKKLEETVFSDVSVGPDLTKIQRQEEKEMKKEAERRNEQMPEQDKAKNLQWMVVGARGEKRIIKTVPRDPPAQRGRAAGRGRGGGARDQRGTRGVRGGPDKGIARGANSTPIGSRQSQLQPSPVVMPMENDGEETESEEEEEEMVTEVETGPETEAERRDKRRKRKGSAERAGEAPPQKR